MRMALALLGAMTVATPAAAAVNLVVNGGFEAGNTGFVSTYNYVAPGGSMVPENTYSVGVNAADYHPSWESIAAFEGSNYFIANGSTANDAPAWSQTINNLIVGNTYDFSAYAVNVCCNSGYNGTNVSPLIIATGTGGNPLTITTSPALVTTGAWTQFLGSFVATSTSTNLSIFTDRTALSGNDYGLDAISVSAAVPEPSIWAMMLIGFGALGFVMRRHSKVRTRVRYV